VEFVVAKRGTKKKGERSSEKSDKAPASRAATEQEEAVDPLQAAQEVDPIDRDDEFEEQEDLPAPMQSTGLNQITIKPSDSLMKKLAEQAGEEGLSVGEYCAELLAEGVVIRAWEIVERKLTMRGGNNSNANQQQHRQHQHRHGQQNNRGNKGHNNRGRMSHSRYQNIMDDKASFLEYVRNQERKNR
jgi:hypothetical protein